ncbi:hypothetical protein GCM10027452_26040 [Micromonospora halotolerans]
MVLLDGSAVLTVTAPAGRNRAAGKSGCGRTRALAGRRRWGPRLVMVRWTGNYRRGNERTAREHPRNRG